jgi:hypothetical protein
MPDNMIMRNEKADCGEKKERREWSFMIKKKGSMRLDESERERKKHTFIKKVKKQLNSEKEGRKERKGVKRRKTRGE